jgi:hypothetical protein
MQNAQKKKYVIIVHDAGAAEIIAAYLVHERDKLDVHAFIAGPAVNVFRREGVSYKKVPNGKSRIMELMNKHTDADLVLLWYWMDDIH